MPFRMAESEGVAVVKVIGVGGGGGNAINTMVTNRLQGVEFIVANTDKQALNQSMADVCLQIGPSITKGLGAGADPETGNMAGMESLEEIRGLSEAVIWCLSQQDLAGEREPVLPLWLPRRARNWVR